MHMLASCFGPIIMFPKCSKLWKRNMLKNRRASTKKPQQIDCCTISKHIKKNKKN